MQDGPLQEVQWAQANAEECAFRHYCLLQGLRKRVRRREARAMQSAIWILSRSQALQSRRRLRQRRPFPLRCNSCCLHGW